MGFPGETERDFEHTLEVVEEVEFDSAFTFVYSPRAGTEAAAMPDQVPEDVKRERMERLVALVQRGAAARNADRVGRLEDVLVEGPSRTDPTLLRGRTRRNTTVNFTGTAAAGDLARVGSRARPRPRSGAARHRSWPPDGGEPPGRASPLWSDWCAFGPSPSRTRIDFDVRLEAWGGGRWPG